MGKISIFELEDWEKEYFTKAFKGHTLTFDKKPLSKRTVKKYEDAEIIVVFVWSKVTKEVLDKMPKLKFIATMSTGFDHIDIEAAKEKGIRVSTVPFYGQNTVAEHAFGLLQALNRHLPDAIDRTRKGRFEYRGLIGRDLAGKTLGIFGTGHIGQYMIKYAHAFEMKVIACDAYPNKALAKKMGFQYVTKKTLCNKSDFISLHLPLLDSTFHILGKEDFKIMKKGVFIVNTGRGPLIETKALEWALNKKIVAGAALDVLEMEGDVKHEAKLTASLKTDKKRLQLLVENHRLMHRRNVIVTPHLAFYTVEAVERIINTTIANVKGALNKRYKNVVHKK